MEPIILHGAESQALRRRLSSDVVFFCLAPERRLGRLQDTCPIRTGITQGSAGAAHVDCECRAQQQETRPGAGALTRQSHRTDITLTSSSGRGSR